MGLEKLLEILLKGFFKYSLAYIFDRNSFHKIVKKDIEGAKGCLYIIFSAVFLYFSLVLAYATYYLEYTERIIKDDDTPILEILVHLPSYLLLLITSCVCIWRVIRMAFKLSSALFEEKGFTDFKEYLSNTVAIFIVLFLANTILYWVTKLITFLLPALIVLFILIAIILVFMYLYVRKQPDKSVLERRKRIIREEGKYESNS